MEDNGVHGEEVRQTLGVMGSLGNRGMGKRLQGRESRYMEVEENHTFSGDSGDNVYSR